MASRQHFTLGGALLVGMVLFCGCLTAPATAPPVAPAPESAPTFVRVAEVAVDSVGEPVPPDPVEVSEKIDGTEGGELHNGRFTLQVPKGAWDGVRVVTMTVPDPAVMQCQLAIDQPDANHFKRPVTLCGMCNNPIGTTSTDNMVFVCQDDMTGKWNAVDGSSSSASTGLVSASLQHFSKYGVVQGKAGW